MKFQIHYTDSSKDLIEYEGNIQQFTSDLNRDSFALLRVFTGKLFEFQIINTKTISSAVQIRGGK